MGMRTWIGLVIPGNMGCYWSWEKMFQNSSLSRHINTIDGSEKTQKKHTVLQVEILAMEINNTPTSIYTEDVSSNIDYHPRTSQRRCLLEIRKSFVSNSFDRKVRYHHCLQGCHVFVGGGDVHIGTARSWGPHRRVFMLPTGRVEGSCSSHLGSSCCWLAVYLFMWLLG